LKQILQQWLGASPWDSVISVNKALCQAQKVEPAIEVRGHEAAQRLWDGATTRKMTLKAVLDICRECHDLAPFTFNNGNTFAAIGRAVEAMLAKRKGRKIPMNIDGATAVVFAELGFPPPLCRGLFVLSRSVGALAHAWEESQSGERNKGPIPRQLLWQYDGPKPRRMKKIR